MDYSDEKMITGERALELLREAVEGNQDWVYKREDGDESCRYVREGRPDCLVGHALARVLPIQRVEALDRLAPHGGSLAARVLDEYVPEVSAGAARVFGEAQQVQDTGGTWGKALAAATQYAEGRKAYQ